ncbi:hypothetical protein [Streptomyces huasconensis]|uniref:hypothetical protein n=1 Tax=Streptomyces huasconensis TaxID=1854574 RepID=UPI0037028920
MTLPHTAYATAMHAALAAEGLPPSVTEVSVTESLIAGIQLTTRDLSMTFTWHGGVRMVWQLAWGWRLDRPDRVGLEEVSLPLMVAPAALVPHVRAALDGMSGADVADKPALWEHYHVLDRQIADWESRPDSV